MKKRLISLLAVASVLLSLSTTAMAVNSIASYNLSSYTVALSASGDEEMLISMSVDGVGTQEKIGVYEITIEQYVNGTWKYYDVIDSFDHPEFFAYNSRDYMGAVTFDGVAGSYFRVTLSVYARDEYTSDTGFVTSPIVLCKA